jgi:hypothetical protein
MDRIAEGTETISSTSETGSIPQTEGEVLEFKEEVISPRQDKKDVWKEQSKQAVVNYEYSKKSIESMHNTMKPQRSKTENNKDKELVQPDQHSRRAGDNPQYCEHDTENMQNTMTLKRNKKEQKREN